MECLHKHMSWQLYRAGDQPRVLKRWNAKHTDKQGRVTTTLREEWGDLDGKHITEPARRVLADAWNEYVAWTKDNT
jgi:hypothetical protein